ncbi:MAG: potassium-transporting ATPase subunit KdpC [Bdellovibrionota bacterium]
MRSQLRPALASLLILTIVTGLIYPAAVTAIGQIVFPEEANGSLIAQDGKIRGSSLIGQPFSSPGYFWPRLSATGPTPYNGGISSGSNLGPINPALQQAVQGRISQLQQADPANPAPIPVDLVTASGSGLDPHISPAAAYWQVSRVAKARNRPEEEIWSLVSKSIERRTLGILGEPRVNVLRLNLALDGLN